MRRSLFEIDTFTHSWEIMAKILDSDLTEDILCDIGMPIIHKSVKYNCRVLCLNRQILMIRPKIVLANDGNYRERRYFASYDWSPQHPRPMEQFRLPEIIRKIASTKFPCVPFGVGIFRYARLPSPAKCAKNCLFQIAHTPTWP